MPNARNTDPSTSHEAARSVDNITLTQEYIIRALQRPATDVALVDRYRNIKSAPAASESGIRSRRSELVSKGVIRDSGSREVLPSGRRAIVWELSR